jgi:homoserine kinase
VSLHRADFIQSRFVPGDSVSVFAPGSVGNLGPGLDILGCALTGLGDTVHATRIDSPGVRIDDPGHPELPTDPQRHACAIASNEVMRRAATRSGGVALRLEKRLPLAGGQGGSAASAIAAAVCTNVLLGSPLTDDDVLMCALVSEERVAGRHLDNLAPALFGGIVLVRSIDPPQLDRLPVPPALRVVIVHPAMRLRTADARAVLPETVTRATAIAQATAVAAMVSAFRAGDLSLLRGAVDDRIAEPARASLLPGFLNAKRAAMDAGSLGCSIAGAGPSAFAFAASDDDAARIQSAMIDAYAREGMAATGRIERVDETGARVESINVQSASRTS